jgi:dipeptidase D
MDDPFASLEPVSLWRHFAKLTKIARPPRGEDAAVAYVRDWADRNGHAARRDAAGNVVVAVPSSAGSERAPTVVLQAHLDMVCERDPQSSYDPSEGRIHVIRDGDWLVADETTLGADDGVGVAAMLAIGDSAVRHGPLELLFTVAEEVGLEGALALDPELISGRILLNLDGSQHGRLVIGCSGSVETRLVLEQPQEVVGGDCTALTVALRGGLGGHSGIDIQQGRINAIRGLARVLIETGMSDGLRLATLQGGNSRNAIPRDADAVIVVRKGAEAKVKAKLDYGLSSLNESARGVDDGLYLTVQETEPPSQAWTSDATSRLLNVARALPCGVLGMSRDFPGVVGASSNIGVAETAAGTLELKCLTRAMSESALEDVVGAIRSIAELASGRLEVVSGYPPWPPDRDNLAVRATQTAFRGLFDRDPELAAAQGGVECAAIGGKVAGISMVSFAATARGLHAPGERVEIPAVADFFHLLVATLTELSDGPVPAAPLAR